MNKDFFAALDLLEKEKGIPKEYMLEKIEAALVSAYKKEYGNNTNVRILINPEKEEIKVFQQKEVVEEVTNPETEISLEDAKQLSKRNTVGKIVEIEIKTKNFRRLSAAAAKSVIIQSIREGERRAMQQAYENKREEIITATVNRVDLTTGNAVLEIGTGRDFAQERADTRRDLLPGREDKGVHIRGQQGGKRASGHPVPGSPRW